MKQPIEIKVNPSTPEIVSWLAACVKMCADYMAATYPTLPVEEIVPNWGTRYIRVEKRSKEIDSRTGRPTHCSAWAFIDRSTGDVLKPATYKAPAKHARGNIFDPQNGMGSMGPYGPAYLR